MRYLIVLGLLALAACAQTSAQPLTLSPAVSQDYSTFLQSERPLFFVVSEDGRHSSWTRCTTSGLAGECDRSSTRRMTLKDCAQKSGKTCYVYADASGVVWKGPVSIGSR